METVEQFIEIELAKYGVLGNRAAEIMAAIPAEGGHVADRWESPVYWCPTVTRALAIKAVERHMGF